MIKQRLIPDNPLSFYRNCIRTEWWSDKSGAWSCLVGVVEYG